MCKRSKWTAEIVPEISYASFLDRNGEDQGETSNNTRSLLLRNLIGLENRSN